MPVLRHAATLTVAATLLSLAACGGGSGSGQEPPPPPSGGASQVQGIATPSSVSVVTAKNAN